MIKVVGSCTLFEVHPDTLCLKEVTFHVTSHECSVVISCVITLGWIQPHNNLHSIPSNASLISSNADHPMNNRSQKNIQVSQPGQKICSSKEQPPRLLPSHEYTVSQCVEQEDPDKTSKWKCQAHVISLCSNKNCKSTLCYDKNCQDTQCVHMWPVKPEVKSSHMQPVKPATKQSTYKKYGQVSLCDGKNCQSTKCVHM